MPIYEYICMECNNRFSLLQSLYPTEHDAECPKCSSNNVKKILSSFSCSSHADDAVPSGPPPRFSGGG